MADPRLTAFLAGEVSRPFVRGRHDCLTWLGDWVAIVRGADPAAVWRGTYTGWFGAARIIHGAGSMAALIDRAVAPLGIERTATPKPGDIAVVQTPDGELGAIRVAAGFAMLATGGLVVARVPMIAAWSV